MKIEIGLTKIESVAEGPLVTGGIYREYHYDWYLGTCSNEVGPLRYADATDVQRDNIRRSLARGLETVVEAMSHHERIEFYRATRKPA